MPSLFTFRAFQCPTTTPGGCLPHCKHWRSNILRACKGLGWDVPSVTVLFCEALWRAAHGQSDDCGFCRLYFDLCDRSSESSVTNRPTTLTDDKDYQATLDFLGVAYSRRSADWLPQLRLLGDDDRHAPWPGLDAAIEEVVQELGIEGLDGYPLGQDTGDDDVCSSPESNENDDGSDSDDSMYVDALDDDAGGGDGVVRIARGNEPPLF